MIPVVLFAYTRPNHLRRTLACLHENHIPLLYVFSDGPKTPDLIGRVNEVRQILRKIDWCEIRLVERVKNLGLGKSILTGVTEVVKKHEAIIVFEDDLICVPGTYQYLCAALEHYKNNPQVMSVTGWTHPPVTPRDITDQPYFDGRAECWVWGTWSRSWKGMDQDARTQMLACEAQGIDRNLYGSDLPPMAENELCQNIWAVRFLYHHILNRGLCLRPPWSMVEHIGFDAQATNASSTGQWANPPLWPCPPLPAKWPKVLENPECPTLWQQVFDNQPSATQPSIAHQIKRALRKTALRLNGSKRFETMTFRDFVKMLTPPLLVQAGRRVVTRILQPQMMSNVSKSSTRPEWEYIPDGWAYTQTHPEVKGWNVQEVLEIYKKKWPQFVGMVQGTVPLGVAHESALTTNEDINSHNIIMVFAYVLALAAHKKDHLSILDWGGGIGHYYLLAQALLPNVKIEYHCKDVPVLCKYGAKLFPQQHFYLDESCFGRVYDLILASTSFQYEENWQALLKHLAKSTSRYLYIANLPIVKQAPSFVFVQRPYQYGYNTEYLAWCLNQTEFLQVSEQARLLLLREFIYGYQPFIYHAPEQNMYRGYLFQARPEKKT